MTINEENQISKDDKAQKVQKNLAWMKLLDFGLEFALIIALPLLLFVFVGKKLDARFHTKFIVLIGIFLALPISSYALYLRIKKIKDLMK